MQALNADVVRAEGDWIQLTDCGCHYGQRDTLHQWTSTNNSRQQRGTTSLLKIFQHEILNEDINTHIKLTINKNQNKPHMMVNSSDEKCEL